MDLNLTYPCPVPLALRPLPKEGAELRNLVYSRAYETANSARCHTVRFDSAVNSSDQERWLESSERVCKGGRVAGS